MGVHGSPAIQSAGDASRVAIDLCANEAERSHLSTRLDELCEGTDSRPPADDEEVPPGEVSCPR